MEGRNRTPSIFLRSSLLHQTAKEIARLTDISCLLSASAAASFTPSTTHCIASRYNLFYLYYLRCHRQSTSYHVAVSPGIILLEQVLPPHLSHSQADGSVGPLSVPFFKMEICINLIPSCDLLKIYLLQTLTLVGPYFLLVHKY